MEATVEVILEFLKNNNFSNTESVLRAELMAMKSSTPSPALAAAVDELPRLPPVRLQLGNYNNLNGNSEDGNSSRSFDSATFLSVTDTPEGFFGLGSFMSQDTSSSGMKISCGRQSASRGMSEDLSDRLSGFATAADGDCFSESPIDFPCPNWVDYPCQNWDSDTYEDDNDPGYHRQQIEDKAWFLAHEIDHPSGDEEVKLENDYSLDEDPGKLGGDIKSVTEEEPWEPRLRNMLKERVQPNVDGVIVLHENNDVKVYEGDFVDLLKMRNPWRCVNKDTQVNDSDKDGCGKVHNHCSTEHGATFPEMASLDSILINNDLPVSGSECMAEENSGGDMEKSRKVESRVEESMHVSYWQSSSFQECLVPSRIDHLESDYAAMRPLEDGYVEQYGFRAYYNESSRQNLDLQFPDKDLQEQCSTLVGLHSTDRKCLSDESSFSSSVKSKEILSLGLYEHSDLSSQTTNDDLCMEAIGEGKEEHDICKERDCEVSIAAEDEDMEAVQDQIQRIVSDEDEYEEFDLKIIHRKNRTGFEEEKDIFVEINSVIAGRYHVSEYLGSAAFSKAIQAHDLHTGMDVCMKIIKNNKDFFDQSLDEIKLLKYVNKHDPADRYHILRLYDYFYHREHLFIVCELLRANLYEFQKFNKESGGEVYFTMPRLQSITRQCLEALDFLHGLGLIHCDLKPENILVKSYSRCEIKVIDLGSSCFQTDHLCSYVQSRSYRAPEVILGLPYDQKIDIWSLGCILAELCSGNVLFQNDSLATLLARIIGILGPIDPEMLAKGQDTHKYFTKNHVLYERIEETEQLEYILPKKTSLSHRLTSADPGFVEFVGYLLQINPLYRPTAKEAKEHPWLSYPYEPISS